MDHIIDFIISYMESDKEEFIEEWKSGLYGKLSDCPSYAYVKTYCDAIKVLNRMDGRYTGITPSSFTQNT